MRFFNMIMMETRQQYLDIKVKMKNKGISILLILMLIMSLQAQGQENTAKEIPTSKVGDLIKGKNYKVDEGRSFHLIQVPSLDKKYLFFSLKVDQIYSHLEFSISIYKQGSQTPFKKCVRQQVDSCYIPRQQITLNQTIFLVIESSGEQCDYEIRSYWSNLEHIQLGRQVRFLFAKEEQKQIYHLELDNPNFNELRIIIKPQTRRLAFDKIKMYGTFGKDSLPSADNYDFKSSYLWQDTQGIFLSKKQIKQLKINLILQGQIETVYTMLCEVVNKTHSDLALNNKIYEYLEQDQSYTYHLDFKGIQGKYDHDFYVFTLAIFTGDFQIQLYKDKERKNRVKKMEPLMYMGDIQYLFSKTEVEKDYPAGIYVYLLSKKRVTTFMLQLEGRSKDRLIELDEHIYQFMGIKDQTVAFFQVSRYGQQNSQQVLEDLKVVFTVLPVYGKVSIQFLQCKSTRQYCISPQFANYSTKINNQYRNVGTKDTYSLVLTNEFWKNVNMAEKNAIVLVILKNLEKQQSMTAVQYSIGNRVEFLRQNKPIQSHVLKNQFKTYKFVNTDPNIESIRLHFNKISGCFSTYVFREQPAENSNALSEKNKINGPILQISDNLTEKPIVILIMGEDSATFSLSVQPIHKDQNELDYVTVSQDVNFKFKIAPNMYQVLQIVPILGSIFFTYQSTGALHLCVLKDGICQDKEGKLANEGQIEIPFFNDRNLYVKLRNPSSYRSIEVNTLFHSKKENHCELKTLSHIYQQIIAPDSCFKTIIDQAKDFEVTLVRQEVGKLSYTMAICDKLLSIDSKENGDQRYRISAEQLITSCQGHAQYSFLFSVGSEKSEDTTKIRIKYLIQYTDSLIILPDGVGYQGNELTTEQTLKKFTYPLLNKIDTTIVLTTQKKMFFLVKFTQSKLRDKTQLSINSYDYSSPLDKFYYLESIYLKITQQMIQKSKCIDCQLLIYVYSKEDIGTIVDFTIEVTQNFFFLEEASPKSNYLAANSKAYYGFKIKQSGTLLIELSDNNLGCSELYLSSSEYPDQVNNLVKSFDGQIIRDVVSSTKVYYITVRARKSCAYTIIASLSTGKTHITKLQRGNLGSFNMEENATKFYTFKHLSDQAFKVLSLHKYGQVQFYLNKTTPDGILALISSKAIDFRSFTYHSPHKNRLLLDKTEKQFCKNCMYILAVHAKKHTISSIFLGDEQTKLPLSEQKVLNDILPKKNMITRGELFFIEKGIVEVKVHSGKLQLELNYKGQIVKTAFQRSQKLQTYNFTFKQQNDYRATVSVVFTALEDNTIYSSRIKPSTMAQENLDGIPLTNIDPSSPNYVYIEKGQPTCVQGFIKRADERVFISFHSNSKDAAEEMKIVGKINGNFTPISQDTTKNVISIAFLSTSSKQLKEVQKYELCLSHETQSISLTILQSQQTSLLPENTEMMVANKQIFDIYPEGDFMLDIFECRGSTKISYGANKKELQESKPKILDLTGIPNQPHAIHLQDGYSNLLLSVEGELSLVRWLRINQDEQKGLGYYVYEAGNLKYNSVFGQIQVIVSPVKQKKKTQTQITNIRYNLYISNNLEDLKYASNCEKYLPNTVIDYQMEYNSLSTADFKFTAKKINIKEHFPKNENLFFTVVADVTIKTTDQSTQEYRFVYQSQQMPAQVFTPNQLESYQMKTLIIVLALFIIAILTFSWVFARVIVPLIARLRNSLLIEENGENSKDKKEQDNGDNLQVPPSSDRQGINFNDLQVVETEQKM